MIRSFSTGRITTVVQPLYQYPLLPGHNRYFSCSQLRNCLTASIIWWYSGYTYFAGEVLMQSKAQRNVMPGCAVLANLVRVLAVACVALLASVAAHPQGSSGRILGVVTDQSGGNVGRATVTITDL